MTKPTAELEAQRRITAEFIAADADVVTIMRRVKQPDGAGGHTLSDPQPMPDPVTVRVQQKRVTGGAMDQRTTLDGRLVIPTHELIASWNADIQRGDEFELEGRHFEVVFASKMTEYETFGEVVEGGR